MTLARLRSISASNVDAENPEYRRPLDRDAIRLRKILEPEPSLFCWEALQLKSMHSRYWKFLENNCSFPETLSAGEI
jgi:hypothetical protein